MICGLGVMEIRSATMHTKFAGAHIKQVYWVMGGIMAMFLMSLFNYQALLDKVHWMYIASIASLVGVILFGRSIWALGVGSNCRAARTQPSEWVKLILILAVAKYFADLHHKSDLSWSYFQKAGMIVGVPMLMVLAQPDLWTALTYMPIAIMGLFLGGVRAKQALTVLLLAGLLMPIAFLKVLKPYQRERLTSFMNPDADRQGSGYQVNQSLIAVGSGGIWGSSEGSQTHLAFLPVPQTDFIFAAFAEEHGFVGALGVLLLYFIVLMRLTQNAQTAPDRAGTFLVMGVVAVLSFHILVNVGMVVGFMPVTGIPLPLMSYGGSSVLFMFLALGMVMNVRMRRFVN
jgi:rod shape determining protein RodA